jgi:hypothetical protein
LHLLKTGLYDFDTHISKDTKFSGKWFTFSFAPSERSVSSRSQNPDLEILVSAKSEKSTERALRLLFASFYIIHGTNSTCDFDIFLPSYKSHETTLSHRPRLSTGGLFKSAFIAAMASFHLNLQRAILKYKLACGIHSNAMMQLDPNNKYTRVDEAFDDDKLRFGYTILILYSVIEELGLEIRASNKNPSVIDGEWNPIVLDDLVERLGKIGVKKDEKISWNRRYKPTRIEGGKQVEIFAKLPWSFGPIRDGLIPVYDAIAIMSWIRSRVVAHRISDIYRSLSVYDVANANNLVRHVLWKLLKMNENKAKFD